MIHSTDIQVRFADVDKLGHVNNAVYLSYCEQARMDFFAHLFGQNGIDWSENGFILARAEIDFILPVYLNDKLRVETACTRIGTRSVDLEYNLYSRGNGNEVQVAKSLSVLVAYDYRQRCSMILPAEWRKKLDSILVEQE